MTLTDKIKKNFYWFPSLLMIASAILKIFYVSPVTDLFEKLDIQDKLVYLGVIELASVIFFLFRPTMLIGFFLICTFWGGVFIASLTTHVTDYFPISILFAFGLALCWRDPSLFKHRNVND